MTKPSASLPVLYARVPVETWALAQLLAGHGKTSVSAWLIALIESQRCRLRHVDDAAELEAAIVAAVAPAKRAFTFAFNNAHTREAQQAAVRLADWVLRSPDIRNGSLTRTLWELSHPACAGEARVDIGACRFVGDQPGPGEAERPVVRGEGGCDLGGDRCQAGEIDGAGEPGQLGRLGRGEAVEGAAIESCRRWGRSRGRRGTEEGKQRAADEAGQRACRH